jgi:two-component system OmpR family response regulator
MTGTRERNTEGSTTRRLHVLVVEDEPALRLIVRRNLERRGIDVAEARTAADALEAIAAEAPDLLLLDINLPDRTGWDVLRELRSSGRPIPRTIVISAVRVPNDRLREFGVEGYLPKPFPIDAVTRLVAAAGEAG